jgi:hypothetical protein
MNSLDVKKTNCSRERAAIKPVRRTTKFRADRRLALSFWSLQQDAAALMESEWIIAVFACAKRHFGVNSDEYFWGRI